MFGRRRASWRDKDGKINCVKGSCSTRCENGCPIWFNTKGIEKLMLSRPDLAISDFRRAIEIAPDFPDAYNNLGSAYGMNGHHTAAYEAFSKALELRSDYPQALRGLILAERDIGKYQDALKHCDEYERLTGTSMESMRDEIMIRMESAAQ